MAMCTRPARPRGAGHCLQGPLAASAQTANFSRLAMPHSTALTTRRLRAILRATQPRTDVVQLRPTASPTSTWPQVEPIAVKLRNAAERASPLPGTALLDSEVVIRQLEPRDADAYVAFNKRMLWRESWHYPMRDEASARDIAARGSGAETNGGGGCLWLVLVETRREQYNGEIYAWEEIWGEGWYKWRKDEPHSTFGLCISSAFQGSGAGRALMSRVLEVADTTNIGPPIIRLTVQNINGRAWRLYESLGFVKLPHLTTTIPERTSHFFTTDGTDFIPQ